MPGVPHGRSFFSEVIAMTRTLMLRLGAIALTLGLLMPATAGAASKAEIDAKVKATMTTFHQQVKSAKELERKAYGVLVFPEVVKAGLLIGGEYGEGALLVHGKTVDYYSTAGGSIGLQLGAQVKSVVVLFMTKEAYKQFRASKGWKAGVDGSVALATLGAGGEVDSETARKPIIGFIFDNKGLMYNLTLEGSKFTKLKK